MHHACCSSKHLGLPFIRAVLYYLGCVHPSHRGYKSLTNHLRADSSRNLVLGVDIGGTKVAVGLVDSRGQIRHAQRAAMIARGSAEQGFRAVLQAMDGLMPQARAARAGAIGVCAPGWVESDQGILLSAT